MIVFNHVIRLVFFKFLSFLREKKSTSKIRSAQRTQQKAKFYLWEIEIYGIVNTIIVLNH